MLTGVNEGFTIDLEINGVGYRAAVEGKDLVCRSGSAIPFDTLSQTVLL